jgi:multidrug efflux pump subunit AcrA (membrane-fusion protein)
MAGLLPGLGVFGTLITTRRRKPLARKHLVGMSVLGLVLLASLFTLGCGGGNAKTPLSSQTTLTVTGTSGALSHSAPVSVTVN